MNEDPRRAAEMYLDIDLVPFPLPPNSKIPAQGFHWKECEVTRNNIEELFQPDSNLAIDCGKSKIGVLDCDTQAAVDKVKEVCDPTGVIARTPGGGWHLYYKDEKSLAGNRTNMGGVQGLDQRGPGGYVLASPSKIDGKPYEFRKFETMAMWKDWFPKKEYEQKSLVTGNESEAELRFRAQKFAEKRPAKEGNRDKTAWTIATFFIQALKMSPQAALDEMRAWNTYFVKPPLPEGRLRYKINEAIKLKH